ncbi:carboxylic ester hydrolase [Aureococcus anophagefferens]|nr:carboxylic ester hydrolase [Aureococcus anophagefferens]
MDSKKIIQYPTDTIVTVAKEATVGETDRAYVVAASMPEGGAAERFDEGLGLRCDERSVAEYGHGHFLTREFLDYVREVAYRERRDDWRVAPLDAALYHDALLAAGAPSELWLARGTVHAFLNNAAAASRRDAGLDKAAAYLRAHLYGS